MVEGPVIVVILAIGLLMIFVSWIINRICCCIEKCAATKAVGDLLVKGNDAEKVEEILKKTFERIEQK